MSVSSPSSAPSSTPKSPEELRIEKLEKAAVDWAQSLLSSGAGNKFPMLDASGASAEFEITSVTATAVQFKEHLGGTVVDATDTPRGLYQAFLAAQPIYQPQGLIRIKDSVKDPFDVYIAGVDRNTPIATVALHKGGPKGQSVSMEIDELAEYQQAASRVSSEHVPADFASLQAWANNEKVVPGKLPILFGTQTPAVQDVSLIGVVGTPGQEKVEFEDSAGIRHTMYATQLEYAYRTAKAHRLAEGLVRAYGNKDIAATTANIAGIELAWNNKDFSHASQELHQIVTDEGHDGILAKDWEQRFKDFGIATPASDAVLHYLDASTTLISSLLDKLKATIYLDQSRAQGDASLAALFAAKGSQPLVLEVADIDENDKNNLEVRVVGDSSTFLISAAKLTEIASPVVVPATPVTVVSPAGTPPPSPRPAPTPVPAPAPRPVPRNAPPAPAALNTLVGAQAFAEQNMGIPTGSITSVTEGTDSSGNKTFSVNIDMGFSSTFRGIIALGINGSGGLFIKEIDQDRPDNTVTPCEELADFVGKEFTPANAKLLGDKLTDFEAVKMEYEERNKRKGWRAILASIFTRKPRTNVAATNAIPATVTSAPRSAGRRTGRWAALGALALVGILGFFGLRKSPQDNHGNRPVPTLIAGDGGIDATLGHTDGGRVDHADAGDTNDINPVDAATDSSADVAQDTGPILAPPAPPVVAPSPSPTPPVVVAPTPVPAPVPTVTPPAPQVPDVVPAQIDALRASLESLSDTTFTLGKHTNLAQNEIDHNRGREYTTKQWLIKGGLSSAMAGTLAHLLEQRIDDSDIGRQGACRDKDNLRYRIDSGYVVVTSTRRGHEATAKINIQQFIRGNHTAIAYMLRHQAVASTPGAVVANTPVVASTPTVGSSPVTTGANVRGTSTVSSTHGSTVRPAGSHVSRSVQHRSARPTAPAVAPAPVPVTAPEVATAPAINADTPIPADALATAMADFREHAPTMTVRENGEDREIPLIGVVPLPGGNSIRIDVVGIPGRTRGATATLPVKAARDSSGNIYFTVDPTRRAEIEVRAANDVARVGFERAAVANATDNPSDRPLSAPTGGVFDTLAAPRPDQTPFQGRPSLMPNYWPRGTPDDTIRAADMRSVAGFGVAQVPGAAAQVASAELVREQAPIDLAGMNLADAVGELLNRFVSVEYTPPIRIGSVVPFGSSRSLDATVRFVHPYDAATVARARTAVLASVGHMNESARATQTTPAPTPPTAATIAPVSTPTSPTVVTATPVPAPEAVPAPTAANARARVRGALSQLSPERNIVGLRRSSMAAINATGSGLLAHANQGNELLTIANASDRSQFVVARIIEADEDGVVMAQVVNNAHARGVSVDTTPVRLEDITTRIHTVFHPDATEHHVVNIPVSSDPISGSGD